MTDIAKLAKKYNGRIETVNGYQSLCGCNVKLEDIKVGQIWTPADGANVPVRIDKIVEDNVYYSAINMDYKNDRSQFGFQCRHLLTDKVAKHTVGDKSNGICETCGLVETTYQYRDVPIRDHDDKVVKHILAGCCDGCGAVIAIPEQSVKQVSDAWKKFQQEKWDDAND